MLSSFARRLLLDTNIVIALFAQEASVLEQFARAVGIVLPCIVLGELYYGARKSGRVAANVKRVDEFAARNVVLSCDMETGQQYGLIREELRIKSRPLPENDVWIAALARQHSLTLVSRDAHFNEIEGLSVVAW